MAKLNTKIRLYCEANSKTAKFGSSGNIILQDDSDGKGPYIETWNVDGLAKPSDSQLAEYETAGNTVETNNGIDANRESQYGTWQEQMEMIYKDQKNGTSTFKDHCDKVRSDNPKG